MSRSASVSVMHSFVILMISANTGVFFCLFLFAMHRTVHGKEIHTINTAVMACSWSISLHCRKLKIPVDFNDGCHECKGSIAFHAVRSLGCLCPSFCPKTSVYLLLMSHTKQKRAGCQRKERRSSRY